MISVENLNVKYKDCKEYSLKNINFSAKLGEVIVILGSLNAGKSTLCRSLNGLIPHFIDAEIKGKVMIDNENVDNISISNISTRIGMILENPLAQITGFGVTVEEEVAFGLENIGISNTEMKQRINEVLKLVDLEKARKQNPFQISGGQQQRLAIASILAMQPKVLVLDEPTSQLDPLGTKEIFDELKKLKQKHIIILATQKVELIYEFADKILLLHKGKMVAFDTPQKVLSNYDLLKKSKVKIPLQIELQKRKKIPINKISFDYKKIKRLIK